MASSQTNETFESLMDTLEIMKEPKIKVCQHCKNDKTPEKLFICSKCKIVAYCNAECQKAEWKAHKAVCSRISSFRSISPSIPAFKYLSPVSETEIQITLSNNTVNIEEIMSLDPEKVPHIDFRLKSALPSTAFVGEEIDEDGEGDGNSLERLQQIIASRTANLPPSLVSVISTEEALDRLEGLSDTVEGQINLTFTIPLIHPTTFTISSMNKDKLLTKGDIAVAISRIYQLVFTEDASRGSFGIKIHKIEDLSLHSIIQYAPSFWSVMVDS